MPTRRPDDNDDDPDDRPRRDDRDDRDDDRPRRRREREDYDPRPPKTGGAGRILLILFGLVAATFGCCCGGCFLLYQYGPKPVTVLDATRAKSPQGGTASAAVNVRVNGDTPGNFIRGDYYFNFKAGGRTSVHNVGLIGKGGGEFKQVFLTPELADQEGPVEFWVERRDRETVFPVSAVHTIP